MFPSNSGKTHLEQNSAVSKELMKILKLPGEHYKDALTLTRLAHYGPLIAHLAHPARAALAAHLAGLLLDAGAVVSAPADVSGGWEHWGAAGPRMGAVRARGWEQWGAAGLKMGALRAWGREHWGAAGSWMGALGHCSPGEGSTRAAPRPGLYGTGDVLGEVVTLAIYSSHAPASTSDNIVL